MSEGMWAKSVLASEHSVTGKRLDSILCRLPRCILAELNTHRAFSRNAASSRAIPISKLIEQVLIDPFIPMVWTKNQPGMQGYEECNARLELGQAMSLPHSFGGSRETAWLFGRDVAVELARAYSNAGYHKQIVNRLLEPWMWTIVLISATEWDNFFKLRNHPAAEPHMQILAQKIWETRENAQVQTLEPGQWHLPFITQDEWMLQVPQEGRKPVTVAEHLIKLSVARCASTSYKTVDGFDMTLEKAKAIYDSLSGPPLHASPFEHVAQADFASHEIRHDQPVYGHPKEHRNFIGFRQFRAQIEMGAR